MQILRWHSCFRPRIGHGIIRIDACHEGNPALQEWRIAGHKSTGHKSTGGIAGAARAGASRMRARAESATVVRSRRASCSAPAILRCLPT
jgi:hypothetical protein